MCFCDTTVEDTAVFTAAPPGTAPILKQLSVGHPGPAVFDAGQFQSVDQGRYTYYSSDGTCCNSDTVFEVTDGNGVKKFLRNFRSSVKIAGTDLSFRNPPQFNHVLRTEYSIAHAEHETDAVLQHLFYHPNTAPFLATRFIQRLGGISSPSPRYVRTVARGTSTLPGL